MMVGQKWSGPTGHIGYIGLLFMLVCPLATAQDVLRMAFHESRPYRVVHQDGTYTGMDLDILHMLGKQMHFKVQVIACPFSRCLLLMKSNKLDLMTGLLKNTSRQTYLNYINPPYYQFNTDYVFYARADNHIQVNSYAELQGHSIVQFRGAKYFERYDNDPLLQKIPLVSETKQIEFLLKGRADLMISVNATIDNTLKSLHAQNKVKQMAYRVSSLISAYMALSKKSQFNSRLAEFQQQLEQASKDGRLAAIMARYGLHHHDEQTEVKSDQE